MKSIRTKIKIAKGQMRGPQVFWCSPAYLADLIVAQVKFETLETKEVDIPDEFWFDSYPVLEDSDV